MKTDEPKTGPLEQREGAVQVQRTHGGKRTGAGRKPSSPRVGPLATWLEGAGVGTTDFARRIGLSPSGLEKILYNPSHRPRRSTALRIERETGGAVPASVWYPAS